MSDTKQRRMHWTRDERDLVAEHMADLLEKQPAIPMKELWIQCQTILDVTRRRPYYTSITTSEKELFAEGRKRYEVRVRKPAPVVAPVPVEPTVIHVPVPTPTPLSEYPFEQVLAEVIGRVLRGWQGAGALAAPPVPSAHGAERPLPSAPLTLMTGPEVGKVRVPKIGVCGLLPDQFRHVKDRINARKVELVFVSTQTSPSSRDWPSSLDYALVTKFARHGHTEHALNVVTRERYAFLQSAGTDAIVAQIEAWVPGAKN